MESLRFLRPQRSSICFKSIPFQLVEAKLAPALARSLLVFFRWPCGGRIAGAAELGIGIVVEVDGGIDQHAVPLASAEQRRIAVALAGRGIEPQPKGCRHDDDVVLACVDAIG